MRVRFWGTRGSLPVALTAEQVRAKIEFALHRALDHGLAAHADVSGFVSDHLPFSVAGTYGGHSSCVQLIAQGADPVVLDMGSGARALGAHLLAHAAEGEPAPVHVFLSHLHWDHLMGFPFFTPIYVPGQHLVVHTGHAQAHAALRVQQAPPGFPVPLDALAARLDVVVHPPGQVFEAAGYRVQALKQRHAGDSYGWRFERAGRTLVYSTDSEHRVEDADELARFVTFFDRADLVIFDAMYSLADAISLRADWGHSSNMVGIELALAARAQRLCLFHHEPASDDAQLQALGERSRRLEALLRPPGAAPLRVDMAYDGLEYDLDAAPV